MIETRLLSTDELLRSLVDEVTEIRVRENAALQIVAELDRRGAATELGYRNLPQVLRHVVRWDIHIAKRWIDNAALLTNEITPTGSELAPKLPLTAEAVAEGALSVEHVAAVAAVMQTVPADREADVVGYARDFEPHTVRTLGAKLAYSLFQDDPEPRDPELTPPPGNQHSMFWKNGRLEIRAKLDKVTGAKYEALLDLLAKPRPTTADEGPDPRTREEREGDALAELVDLMLRADQLPEHGGEPVTLTLTMPYEDLANQVGHATLDNGDRVPVEQVRELACNAGIIPMVLGGAGQPLNVGRKTRTFPAAIRRILVTRDRGCAFPGCGRPPRQCDAHHITHWANGGNTSVDNAVLLCRHHHTLIHQSKWNVKLVNGIPTFYAPEWLDPLRKPRRNPINIA
ncbi:HNH endonuclease signature motif containing protein [Lentzea aerocolonigenes]|uniref:HNH endonuclease signature motif containing protein n=1 Tax=Lentzea aerocolonigenes TaxID=68170 RepID=UPI0020A2D8B0|nr:HNH endonuclease signature motif containing protein [Lentzea aerocolonigenes]MCP2246152.1 HNH endonuclease [Lentzea aerocolonigenes]